MPITIEDLINPRRTLAGGPADGPIVQVPTGPSQLPPMEQPDYTGGEPPLPGPTNIPVATQSPTPLPSQGPADFVSSTPPDRPLINRMGTAFANHYLDDVPLGKLINFFFHPREHRIDNPNQVPITDLSTGLSDTPIPDIRIPNPNQVPIWALGQGPASDPGINHGASLSGGYAGAGGNQGVGAGNFGNPSYQAGSALAQYVPLEMTQQNTG